MMTIDELAEIKELNLTPDEYFFLMLVYHNNLELLNWSIDYSKLERNGYIIVKGPKMFEMTPKTIDLFDKEKQAIEEVELWIDDWLNFFPKGLKSGGYLVRSDRKSCIRKMKRFIKNYKFDKNTIFLATKSYMDSKREGGYQFVMCAHYFIEKSSNSTLASYCAEIIDPAAKVDTFRSGDHML